MAENSTAPASAATAAFIRQAVLAVGAFAVGRGWVTADQLPGIATILASVGAAAWGLYKTHQRQTDIKKAEAVVGPVKNL